MKRQFLLWLLLLVAKTASAGLVFSAPPRGSEAEERATYEPLVRAMSEWIGTEIVYEYPKDFITYSFRMREGRYDLVFDGPHFASWRIKHLQHEVVANLPEKLVFLLVTPTTNKEATDLESLIARKVCGQAPPQLGTLFVMSQYSNPVQEPILQTIKGEDNVYKALRSGECAVAVLRDKTYYKMSEAERANYKVLYTSRPVPNDAITVGRSLTTEQRKILREKLVNPESAKVAAPLFKRFSNEARSFEVSDAGKFAGLDMLLENLSFGW